MYTLIIKLNNNRHIKRTYNNRDEFIRDAFDFSRTSNVLEVIKIV